MQTEREGTRVRRQQGRNIAAICVFRNPNLRPKDLRLLNPVPQRGMRS